MTLVDFLLARIAEDEEVVRHVYGLPIPNGSNLSYALTQAEYLDEPFDGVAMTSIRMLAECKAKRQIVEEWRVGVERLDDKGRSTHLYDPVASMLLKSHAHWLHILASVYADHPDYKQEWKV